MKLVVRSPADGVGAPKVRNVVAVRKEPCRISGVVHEHVVGVFTDDGAFTANADVVESLKSGAMWQVLVPGSPPVRLRARLFCPAKACVLRPYLWTDGGPDGRSELEDLLPCW